MPPPFAKVMSSSFPSRGLHDWRFLWNKSTTEAGTAECFCVLCWSVEIALWQSSKGWFLMEYYFRIYPVIRDSSFKRHMLSWCHTGPTPFSPTFKPERLMRYQPWEPDWTANVYINPTLTNLRVSQRISQGCPLKVVQFVNFVDFQFFIQQRSARSSSFDAKAEMFWSVAGWCYQSTGMCNEATVQTNGYILHGIVLLSQVHMFYNPRNGNSRYMICRFCSGMVTKDSLPFGSVERLVGMILSISRCLISDAIRCMWIQERKTSSISTGPQYWHLCIVVWFQFFVQQPYLFSVVNIAYRDIEILWYDWYIPILRVSRIYMFVILSIYMSYGCLYFKYTYNCR